MHQIFFILSYLHDSSLQHFINFESIILSKECSLTSNNSSNVAGLLSKIVSWVGGGRGASAGRNRDVFQVHGSEGDLALAVVLVRNDHGVEGVAVQGVDVVTAVPELGGS